VKKWYLFFRIGGYAGGLFGLALFIAGRRTGASSPTLAAAGGTLIIAGFISFFCSYVIYMAARLRRR